LNAKQFRRYLDRDGGCLHCGEVETAVPHHRLNRGMGGSKARDVPSNIIALCASVNGLLESSALWARIGRDNGWKLVSGDSPASKPVFDANVGAWFILNDDYERREATRADH
jgi:hypothetical protein